MLIDRVSADGAVGLGFLPSLSPLIGANAFTGSPHACRFANVIASGVPTGQALAMSWERMQSEVGERVGVLATDAA